MSFILDALRKSEHERQRQAGPAIADLQVARPSSPFPVALLALGALLAVNLVALLYFMLRSDAPEAVREEPVAATPSPSTTRPTNPAPVIASARPPAPPVVAAAPRRPVRPLSDVAAEEPQTPPAREAPDAPDPMLLPAAPAASQYPSGAGAQAPASRPTGQAVPRLDTLPAEVTAGLPPLNLDLHIYASDPAQRAAFINGRRYKEGDSLPEGVEVRTITPEGAVLQYRGQRFLLPRQ